MWNVFFKIKNTCSTNLLNLQNKQFVKFFRCLKILLTNPIYFTHLMIMIVTVRDDHTNDNSVSSLLLSHQHLVTKSLLHILRPVILQMKTVQMVIDIPIFIFYIFALILVWTRWKQSVFVRGACSRPGSTHACARTYAHAHIPFIFYISMYLPLIFYSHKAIN